MNIESKNIASNIIKEILENISYPYINCYEFTSDNKNFCVVITISLDKEEIWEYGYLENSSYFKFVIHSDGTMKCLINQPKVYDDNGNKLLSSQLKKFRQCKVKNTNEIIEKLKSHIINFTK